MALDAQEALRGIYSLIAAIIAIILALIHLFRTRQDLFTKERRSVSYRRVPPKLSAQYTLMVYLKSISIFCFTTTLVVGAILRNFSYPAFDCIIAELVLVTSWKIALIVQYWTYMLYLYQCYPDPPFGYRIQTLVLAASIIGIVGIVMTIGLNISLVKFGEIDYDIDGLFPFHCGYKMNNHTTVIAFGIIIVLWDLFVSIGSIYAFIRPWNKLLEKIKQSLSQSDDELYNKQYKKMLYTGYKYKIIVTAASSTTVLWIIIMMIGFFEVGRFIAICNYLISIICLMLMTPYYPNDKWFKNLCCLCLLCDRNIHKYDSKASIAKAHNNQGSVDTDNVIQKIISEYHVMQNSVNANANVALLQASTDAE